MVEKDTIELLKECNAGIKMGVNGIEEIYDKVEDERFKRILDSSKEEHQRLGSETHELLNRYHDSGKEPGIMAKSMSWLKMNMTFAMEAGDGTAADLLTDGCNMGIKSLNRYMNKYKAAEEKAKDIAKRLVNIEERLVKDMRPYL